MKRLFASVVALSLAIAVNAGNPGGDTYTVDNNLSKMEWVGKKVTGEHSGTVNVKEGSLTVENGMITGGTIMVDMTTIAVTDIEDPGTNAKLKGHLTSDDFFGVNNHPTAMLKITKVEKKEGNLYHIHGELTIKGKTAKVEIPATVKMEGDKLVAVGSTDIDRTNYDVKYGSGKFFEGLGDKMIYDDFTVKFKVGARKG